MRRVRANCARPLFQLETFASIRSESATSGRLCSAFTAVHPRSRRRFATEAVCSRDTPVISLPVSHDPRTRASTQFCKRRPCFDRARTALLDAVRNSRSGLPIPISTSVKRRRDRPGPGRRRSFALSIAALVSVASAPGAPTLRTLPALLLLVAKVRKSNQTSSKDRRSGRRLRSKDNAVGRGFSYLGWMLTGSAARPFETRSRSSQLMRRCPAASAAAA